MLSCNASVSGTHAFVSLDGEELPHTFDLFGTVTITSGALTLMDSTFEFTAPTLVSGGCANGTPTFSALTLRSAEELARG